MWFLEDLPLNARISLGSTAVSEADILRFGRAYDPQPFHLEHAAAEASHFGGLVASGWHTGAMFMRAFVDYTHRLAEEMRGRGETPARLGPSPGLSDIRWPKGVYAGDTLAFATTPSSKRPLASRPGWGLVIFDNLALNQHGTTVMTFRAGIFVERRS